MVGYYTITVCNQPTWLTQPCILPGSLNRVPASDGGKGWNVTSAGWQVTPCDPIWHVSSSSGEARCELLYPVTLLYFTVGGVRFCRCRLPSWRLCCCRILRLRTPPWSEFPTSTQASCRLPTLCDAASLPLPRTSFRLLLPVGVEFC